MAVFTAFTGERLSETGERKWAVDTSSLMKGRGESRIVGRIPQTREPRRKPIARTTSNPRHVGKARYGSYAPKVTVWDPMEKLNAHSWASNGKASIRRVPERRKLLAGGRLKGLARGALCLARRLAAGPVCPALPV